jgi:predicted acylesterase/phospholipase RssA
LRGEDKVSGTEQAAAPGSIARQHAVIFSGNGYNAAYELGVLKALLHGVSPATRIFPAKPAGPTNPQEKIQPEIYAGTSVGAYSAAFMVAESGSSDLSAVERLEQGLAPGVGPRVRGNPFEYLNPGFYLSNLSNPLTPFLNLAGDALTLSSDLVRRAGEFFGGSLTRPLAAFQNQVFNYEWDILSDISSLSRFVRNTIVLEKIHRSNKELRITAANWEQGTTRTFENKDFVGEAGYQIITAALAIPGAVPRQRIDHEEYVDGAMLMAHPLQPAIEARDRESKRRLVLHVIYLDPEFGQGPLRDVHGSFSTVYRLFLLAFSRAVNADIERVKQTNRDRKYQELLEALDPDSEVMRLWGRLNQETKDSPEIEVHRYRSTRHLRSILDIFQASTEQMKRWNEIGYADAQEHDCQKAECVLISQQ